MSWMNMLYQTYENNADKAGKCGEEAVLPPPAHMNANADVEITINAGGEFRNARRLEKNQRRTLIPVTEQSAGARSSGTAPHALCDTLSYIAGDFPDFLGKNEEKNRRVYGDRFTAYMGNLAKWKDSPHTHEKVQAIYQYLSKKCVTSDLVKENILACREDGSLADGKINNTPYEKVLVRFRVNGCEADGPAAVWMDENLQKSFTEYYLSVLEGRRDICYLKGDVRPAAVSHPKGIVAANYGAKLISANDTQGFTYRGRFQDAQQASVVSYEASQKVHGALTWLAAKQGVSIGIQDRCTYICWNPKGIRVPDIMDPYAPEAEEESEDTDLTESGYRKKLKKALDGYTKELRGNDDIAVIGLDAATTGRLSVIYYHELKASDFLERLEAWGETFAWYHKCFRQDGRPYYEIKSPSVTRLVEYAFGTQQGKFIELSDKLLKNQVQRLLPCLLERQPIPRDLVHSLVIKASSPHCYTAANREKIISAACAAVRKYRLEKGEKAEMQLDRINPDRSYLFGRLLAVLEIIERSTYVKEETREPNAIRLQTAYVNHPMQTWRTLETLLNPYIQRLSPGLRTKYRKEIQTILEMLLDKDEDSLNHSLRDTYLLGYYLERMDLYKNKEKKDDEPFID